MNLDLFPGFPWILRILLFCLWIALGRSLQIDNEVVGVPQIRCSENAITFSLRTRNLFRGNIYVKNQFQLPQCRQEYFSNDYNGASFTVRIGECGMRRIRQLSPNGMNYILVFVANFHPQFVTKIDRGYNVRCFYAQIDKTVSSQLEVSMLSTQTLEESTMLLPQCEYTVRSGSLNGPIVRFARVGDRLVHRWECNNPNYGMLVKNCFVQDGSGSSIRVLDTRGCPVFTPVIQGPLLYDNSLNLAYVEIWAYKFPDRSSLFFQCQIQICNKRENECVGLTPPNCPRVLKSEFEANSVTVAGVPTQVISSGSGVVVGSQSSGYLTNQQQIGQPGYISGGQSGRIVGGSGSNVVSGSGNLVQGSSGQTGYAAAVQRRIQESQQTGLSRFGLEGLRAAQDFRKAAKDDPIEEDPEDQNRKRRQQPVEIDVFAPYKAKESHATGSPYVPGSTETPEDLENTLDVTSETVFVAEVEDDPDNSDGYTHFPFTTVNETANSGHSSVCLNPLAVGLLMSCFGFCIVVIFALVFYILSAVRSKRMDRSKSSSSSTYSSSYPQRQKPVLSDASSEASGSSSPAESRRTFDSSLVSDSGSTRNILPLVETGKKWSLPKVLKRKTELSC